jgi:hypothetical protein
MTPKGYFTTVDSCSPITYLCIVGKNMYITYRHEINYRPNFSKRIIDIRVNNTQQII